MKWFGPDWITQDSAGADIWERLKYQKKKKKTQTICCPAQKMHGEMRPSVCARPGQIRLRSLGFSQWRRQEVQGRASTQEQSHNRYLTVKLLWRHVRAKLNCSLRSSEPFLVFIGETLWCTLKVSKNIKQFGLSRLEALFPEKSNVDATRWASFSLFNACGFMHIVSCAFWWGAPLVFDVGFYWLFCSNLRTRSHKHLTCQLSNYCNNLKAW